MQPRALKRLLQLSAERQLEVIAEGLDFVAENVAALGDSVSELVAGKQPRAVTMLSSQADEEAAKALILFDLVRMDQGDQEAVARQISRFYSHLVRWIYVEVTQASPADFAEVRRMVDRMRPSHYLDGPNEVDWVFRNELLARREENLYVDYVHDDEGDRWVTPAKSDDLALSFGGPPTALWDLLGSFRRAGFMSPQGLAIIREEWLEVAIEDSTHWQEILKINRAVVHRLVDEGLARNAKPEDMERIVDCWTFPMSGLDLSEVKVPISELRAEQESRDLT